MKSIIENLHRFMYLNDAQKNSLEQKAQAHLRYSNISFNVMKVDDKEVIIQTVQLKQLSENYADADRLVKVTESVFSPMLYGRKLKVGAKPYVPAPADDVTPQWIRDHMAKQHLKASDLEVLLGIDKSTLSLYLSGKRELSRPVKSMFFYFFAYNELIKSKDFDASIQLYSIIDTSQLNSPKTESQTNSKNFLNLFRESENLKNSEGKEVLEDK